MPQLEDRLGEVGIPAPPNVDDVRARTHELGYLGRSYKLVDIDLLAHAATVRHNVADERSDSNE